MIPSRAITLHSILFILRSKRNAKFSTSSAWELKDKQGEENDAELPKLFDPLSLDFTKKEGFEKV